MAQSERKGLGEKNEVRGQAKKPYTTPRLVRLGSVEELTHGHQGKVNARDFTSLVGG